MSESLKFRSRQHVRRVSNLEEFRFFVLLEWQARKGDQLTKTLIFPQKMLEPPRNQKTQQTNGVKAFCPKAQKKFGPFTTLGLDVALVGISY
jgi:hypothetical protein